MKQTDVQCRLSTKKKYTRTKPPADEILMTSHKETCLMEPCGGQAPDVTQYDSNHPQIQCQIYHAIINECPYMRVLHTAQAPCENPGCELQHSSNTLNSSGEDMTLLKNKTECNGPQLVQDSYVYNTKTPEVPRYYKYKYSDENVDVAV